MQTAGAEDGRGEKYWRDIGQDLHWVVPSQTKAAAFLRGTGPSQKPRLRKRERPAPGMQPPTLSSPACRPLHPGLCRGGSSRGQAYRSQQSQGAAGAGLGLGCPPHLPGNLTGAPAHWRADRTPGFQPIPLDCIRGSPSSRGQGNILGRSQRSSSRMGKDTHRPSRETQSLDSRFHRKPFQKETSECFRWAVGWQAKAGGCSAMATWEGG